MKKILIFGVIFMISSVVSAGSIWCTGTISNLYIDSGKNVYIRGGWRNDYTEICKTDGSRGGIDVVTCSLWFSLASSAMTNDLRVTLQYDDQGGNLSCENIPTYHNAPTPKYLMLRTD